LLAGLSGCTLLFATAEARAAEPSVPFGTKGHLVIDQISGVRMSTDSSLGISYYGPIGFSKRNYSSTALGPGGGESTAHLFTWWVAPSADFFVIDNVSVGALIEFSQTSGSVDAAVGNGATQNFSLPTTTNITVLPRVGYFIPFGDRFGFWPRLGFGYASRQSIAATTAANQTTKDTFGAFLFDIDAGVVARISDFFFKLSPDVSFSLSGSHTQDSNGVSSSANANVFQFGVTTGVGGIIPL
jgi:hypothetical protein